MKPPTEVLVHDLDEPVDADGQMDFDVLDGEPDDDPAEVEAAWAEEIRRRIEEIRNGTAELYDLEDVLAEMKERYG